MTYPVPGLLSQSQFLNLILVSSAAPTGYPVAISSWTEYPNITSPSTETSVRSVIGFSGNKFSVYLPVGTTKVSVLLSSKDILQKERVVTVSTDQSATVSTYTASFSISQTLGAISPLLDSSFKVVSTINHINHPSVITASAPLTVSRYLMFEMSPEFYAETQLDSSYEASVNVTIYGEVSNTSYILNSTQHVLDVTPTPAPVPSPSPSPTPTPSTSNCSTGLCGTTNETGCGTGLDYTATPTGIVTAAPTAPPFDPSKPGDIATLLSKIQGSIEYSHLAQVFRTRIEILEDLANGFTNFKNTTKTQNGVIIDELLAMKNALNGAGAYIDSQIEIEASERQSLVKATNTMVAYMEKGWTAALQEQSRVQALVNGDLFAEHYIKIDLAGNVSGYGLSAAADKTGASNSDFRVTADSFSIGPPAYVSNDPPPTDQLFIGKIWQDTSTGGVNPTTGAIGTTKWWNGITWQTTPHRAAQPFVYYSTPQTMSDNTVVPPGLYVNNATIYRLAADKIDTRGLTIKDDSGNVIFGAGTSLDWELITGINRPQSGATVGAPIGTMVGGVKAEDMATAVENYNKANDRNPNPISSPSIPVSAVEHALQTDGSADVSFDWVWNGIEGDIDGFFVFVRHFSDTNKPTGTYTFGTETDKETVYTVPAAKRAFILYGTTADRHYVFGVQAYRAVDKNISSSGLIRSSVVSTQTYKPSSSVAFAGDITGTVNGIASNVLTKTASDALSIANKATEDLVTISGIAADIASDNKLTPVEKQTARSGWDSIYREYLSIFNQATDFGIVDARNTYLSSISSLGIYLNGGNTNIDLFTTIPLWINDSNLSITTNIDGPTFRNMWVTYAEKRQLLLNEIAKEASKRADWSTVSGSGKPQDNADVTANNIARGINGQGALATQSFVQVGETVKFPDGSVMGTGDFINKLHKIGTNNISTFMESAAIGNAYIGNAAVKTLNIDGNAVIVPSGSTGTYSTSVSIWMDYPGVVAVIGTFTQGDGKDKHPWRVTHNGSTLQAESPNAGSLGAIITGTSAGTGLHNFGISCDVASGDGRCGIIVLGIKR